MKNLVTGKDHSYDDEGHQTANDLSIFAQEARWIEAAQVNSADFEPLYLRYRERVYRYVRTRLASDEDAADLTQQIFLQAMIALPKYRQRGVPFAVWLFRIARYAAINLSSRQPERVSWDALPETVLFIGTVEPGPEEFVMRQEALGYLRELLSSLNAEKRELLALRFAAGLNSIQIAALVGKKPEAVKKQINRLLQSFREHYQHEHS